MDVGGKSFRLTVSSQLIENLMMCSRLQELLDRIITELNFSEPKNAADKTKIVLTLSITSRPILYNIPVAAVYFLVYYHSICCKMSEWLLTANHHSSCYRRGSNITSINK